MKRVTIEDTDTKSKLEFAVEDEAFHIEWPTTSGGDVVLRVIARGTAKLSVESRRPYHRKRGMAPSRARAQATDQKGDRRKKGDRRGKGK